jgi:hypothetical protein
LTMTAGLFLVCIFGSRFFCNCFTICNPGDTGIYFDFLICFDFIQNNIDLQLSHS